MQAKHQDPTPGVSRLPRLRISDDESTRALSQVVHCSRCDSELPIFNSNGSGFLPPDAIRQIATRKGWLFDIRKGRHFCEKCASVLIEQNKTKKEEHLKVETVANSSPTLEEQVRKITEMENSPIETSSKNLRPSELPPRTPLPADLRKIVRALDEKYDELARRYRDLNTDQTLGKELNVPWAWVAQERVRLYGEMVSAPNDETVRLIHAANTIRNDLSKAMDEYLAIGARLEKLEPRVKELFDRLKKVENASDIDFNEVAAIAPSINNQDPIKPNESTTKSNSTVDKRTLDKPPAHDGIPTRQAPVRDLYLYVAAKDAARIVGISEQGFRNLVAKNRAPKPDFVLISAAGSRTAPTAYWLRSKIEAIDYKRAR